MEKRTRSVMTHGITWVTGLLVGAGVGVLMAPQSGVRTRRRLWALAEDLGEGVRMVAEDTKKAVGCFLKKKAADDRFRSHSERRA